MSLTLRKVWSVQPQSQPKILEMNYNYFLTKLSKRAICKYW